MSYISPIDLIMSNMNMQTEDEICRAVQKVGVNVDKDELLKALHYDRDQYQKGYADRDEEIVRCLECKWNTINGEESDVTFCHLTQTSHHDDWFCADGERR